MVTATTYRLSWEMVRLSSLGQFSNADPRVYANTAQTVPNSQIPDEHWHSISKETRDPWDQYRTLKQWADEDREFVRKVRLQKLAGEPEWVDVDDASTSDGDGAS